MTRSRFAFLLLVISCFVSGGVAQAPAPSNDGLLLPVALGFLLKIVLVVLGGMIKLLFLGFTSLGTSGIALVLGILFLKNQGLAIPPAWSPHHRVDQVPPPWLRQYAGFAHYRQRNAKQLDQNTSLYKPDGGKHNGEHPVPVLDPRGGLGLSPHHVVARTLATFAAAAATATATTATETETENATTPKRTSNLTQTHALAN